VLPGGHLAAVLIGCNIVSVLVIAVAYLLAKRLNAAKVFKYASVIEAIILAAVVGLSYMALLSLVLGFNVVVLISVLSFIILQYTVYPKFILKGLKLSKLTLNDKVLSNIKPAYIYLADLGVFNAFSIDNHFSKIIIFDRKFHEVLSEDEFKAVVLHEYLHLKSYDILYLLSLALTPLIIFSIGVYFLIKGCSFIKARKLIEKAEGFLPALVLTILGLLFLAIVVPIYLPAFSFMRMREHVADLYSVRVLKNSSVKRSLSRAGCCDDAESFAKSPFAVLRSIIFFSSPIFSNRKLFDRIIELLLGSTLFNKLRKSIVEEISAENSFWA